MPEKRKLRQFTQKEVDRLVQFYEEAEKEILDRLSRALLKGNKTEYLAGIRQNIDSILKDLRNGSKTWTEQAVPRVYTQGLLSADNMVKSKGQTVSGAFGAIHQQAAQVLAENTFQKLDHVAQVIGRRADDILRDMALENIRGSVVGYDTWKQVARRYREQLAQNGVTGFQDSARRNWNMKTYAQMVARTSTMEAHLQGTLNRLTEHGHDLVKISSHPGACPLCEPWQGKILSITGKTDGYPTLEEAKAKGLFHPNCRHALGLSIDLDEELEEEIEVSEEEVIEDEEDERYYPKEIAGVVRGRPMSREEANFHRPNPKFKEDEGYRINCQSCVVTYEARLRGYDVQTLPNTPGSRLDDLSRNTALAWIDPKTGTHPEYIVDQSVKSAKKAYIFLDKVVEKGARYTIQFQWKGRNAGAHIVSLDKNDEGVVRIYDPQTGKTYVGREVFKYLNEIKYVRTFYGKRYPVPPKLLRIDEMNFNKEMVDHIMEASNDGH